MPALPTIAVPGGQWRLQLPRHHEAAKVVVSRRNTAAPPLDVVEEAIAEIAITIFLARQARLEIPKDPAPSRSTPSNGLIGADQLTAETDHVPITMMSVNILPAARRRTVARRPGYP